MARVLECRVRSWVASNGRSKPSSLDFNMMPQQVRHPFGINDESENPHRWFALSTLVLWLSVTAVGVAGPLWPDGPESRVAPEEEPPPIEVLIVELTAEPVASSTETVIEDPVSKAPPIEVAQEALPDPSPLAQVASPSVPMAFPVPTEEPAQEVIEAKEAASSVPPRSDSESTETTVATSGQPAAQALVFGRGEGRQPAPRYPRTALREQQEGAVTCVFTVEASGRVSSVEVTEPCQWPLLNQEAARVIGSRWRFKRGDVRRYQITIHFRIQ